jgi:hypothetical protein
MSTIDPDDTQPYSHGSKINHRKYIPATWKPRGAGGGHPKLSGGITVDTRTGNPAPTGLNRVDQRYQQSVATLNANRASRATSEYAAAVILLGNGGIYEVRSPSGNNYDVAPTVDNCDCPDQLKIGLSGKTGAFCKHIHLVNLALADPMLPHGPLWATSKLAEYLSISERTAEQLCENGTVSATKKHDVWMIDITSGMAQLANWTSTIPTLTGVSPSIWPLSGIPTTITLTGTNFVSGSKVYVDATIHLTTTSITSTSIKLTFAGGHGITVGAHNVRITNEFPKGGTSKPLNFTAA